MYDVYTCDEAFMTSSPFCILPVTRFMSLDIQDAKMGKITKKLMGITQYKTREYIEGRNIIDIDQASKGG